MDIFNVFTENIFRLCIPGIKKIVQETNSDFIAVETPRSVLICTVVNEISASEIEEFMSKNDYKGLKLKIQSLVKEDKN